MNPGKNYKLLGPVRWFLVAGFVSASLAWAEPGNATPGEKDQSFHAKRVTGLMNRAISRMDLTPWQTEACGIFMNECHNMKSVFIIGSGLEGEALKNKIRDVYEYTFTRIDSLLTADQKSLWADTMARSEVPRKARNTLARAISTQRSHSQGNPGWVPAD